jgi:hypothetical protein
VAGWGVVRVTRLVHLVPVRKAERDASTDDVAPVRALAAVVGKALEERRRVGALAEVLEADRIAVELPVVPFHHAEILVLGRVCLGDLRHRSSFLIDITSGHSVQFATLAQVGHGV